MRKQISVPPEVMAGKGLGRHWAQRAVAGWQAPIKGAHALLTRRH
ncbi:hypothetical protein [Aquimonas voraii]|nr:hypothetical protein [Aquimonas voraii]